MEVTREMAHFMASWWGDKVRGDIHHDNGDRYSIASAFSGIFADMLNKPADKSQIDKFVDVLTDRIFEKAKENPIALQFCLDCDYAPSIFLSDAAIEAGISPNNFPWKTSMAIRENQNGETIVEVSAGYGASWEQIYPVEGD